MGWINEAQDRNIWRALLNALINFGRYKVREIS
jgi:hypothetical protein